MAKDKSQLDSMIEPQSRIEEFLSRISGKTNSIQQLPEPQSRIEEYLEYIALNGIPSGSQVDTTNLAKLNEANTFLEKNIFEKDIILKNNGIYIGECMTGSKAGGSKRIGRKEKD